jgi:hypothetical protein
MMTVSVTRPAVAEITKAAMSPRQSQVATRGSAVFAAASLSPHTGPRQWS